MKIQQIHPSSPTPPNTRRVPARISLSKSRSSWQGLREPHSATVEVKSVQPPTKYLPKTESVRENPLQSKAKQVPPSDMLAPFRGCETVLLLNDKPVMRGAVAGVLRQLGYRVLEAVDSVQAKYHAHARRKIHLLVISLPDSDVCHLELAQWFHAIYPETRILMISNSCWEVTLHFGGPQQIAVLAQPFTPFELSRMVRLLLDEACRATTKI